MNFKELKAKISTNLSAVTFQEVMDVVDAEYSFTATAFQNGEIHNKLGENSGSCKIFSFAKLNNLSKDETLNCFGDYYRQDVLLNIKGNDHQNIRNFMKFGWEGIKFESSALI